MAVAPFLLRHPVYSVKYSERTFDFNQGKYALVWKSVLRRDASHHLTVPRRLRHRRYVTHLAFTVVHPEADERPGRLRVLEDTRLVRGDEHPSDVAVVHHDPYVRRTEASVDRRLASDPGGTAAPHREPHRVHVARRGLRQHDVLRVQHAFTSVGQYREQLDRMNRH